MSNAVNDVLVDNFRDKVEALRPFFDERGFEQLEENVISRLDDPQGVEIELEAMLEYFYNE
jgi:hypothetical protein